MTYNGFYTRQEQEDALATQITNPNRVGSGFINLGPQQRFAQNTAANWQTSTLLGGGGGGSAPQQVAQIWNAPQPAGKAQAQTPASLQPPMGNSPFMGGRPMPQAQAQQPLRQHFANGGPPPLGMLNNPPPPAANINTYQALGNGSVSSRMQAPFNAPANHQQYSLGQQPNTFATGSNAFNSHPPARKPAVAVPAAKTLQSAADYAAAAQQYKPPPARGPQTASAASVSRKAETGTGPAAPNVRGTAAEPRAREWECIRCTFLNNGSLWECEMCGFERPGKVEHQAAMAAQSVASQDAGWQTASQQRRPAQANPTGPVVSGKTKAQSKNEKRRAKKRDDM